MRLTHDTTSCWGAPNLARVFVVAIPPPPPPPRHLSPRWDVAGAIRVRGLPAHGAPARPTPLAGLRGQFWTEGVPPRREKVLSSSDPLIVPVEYFSAGIIAWHCTQMGLTSMVVCSAGCRYSACIVGRRIPALHGDQYCTTLSEICKGGFGNDRFGSMVINQSCPRNFWSCFR